MLPINLEAFGRAANWSRLPPALLARDLQTTVVDERFPGAVLPALNADGRVQWYVATKTHSQWRQLSPLLVAYIGRTVTDFVGKTTEPDPRVPADQMLIESGVSVFARFTPGARCGEFAIQALERLRMAIARRTTSAASLPEPTSRLLTRLEMSLVAGARTDALRLFEQLQAELRLDTLNLHFLEVRIYAAFREWQAMVESEWFAPLCHARKPAVVAAAMLEALWYARLAAFEGNVGRLEAEYRDWVQSLARPLIRQTAHLNQADLLDRFRRLDSGEFTFDHVNVELAQVGPDHVTKGVVAQELLEQAVDASSIQTLTLARNAIETLPAESRAKLLNSSAARRALAEVKTLGQPLPTSWLEWLRTLSDPNFDGSAEIAREGVVAWSIRESVGREQVELLEEELLRIAVEGGVACDRLVEALPFLMRWVKDDSSYPRPAFRGLYEAVLQLFSVLERRDSSAREAAADVLDAVLTIGSTAGEYRRCLSDFSVLIDEGAGASSVYWLIDVAAMLLHHTCPDTNARLVVLNRILDSIQPLLAGLTVGQRATYNRIASSASWPEVPGSAESDPAFASQLTGKTIAIYTLTESAGRQAEIALNSMFENLRVELAFDQVASPRLVRLSREADVFVLASASAKHAATDCIQANRGKKILLHAAGRGFSSIVRVVEEYIQLQ